MEPVSRRDFYPPTLHLERITPPGRRRSGGVSVNKSQKQGRDSLAKIGVFSELQYREESGIRFLWRFLADSADFPSQGGGFPPTYPPVLSPEFLCDLWRPKLRTPPLPYSEESPLVVILLYKFLVSPPERGLLSPVVFLSVADILRGSFSSSEIPFFVSGSLLCVEDSVPFEDRPGDKLPEIREEVEPTTETSWGVWICKVISESPRFQVGLPPYQIVPEYLFILPVLPEEGVPDLQV